MKTVNVKINPETLAGLPRGRVNKNRLDATREKDIASQMAKDDAEAMQDAAKFTRRVRRRLWLSQMASSFISVFRSHLRYTALCVALRTNGKCIEP